MRHTVLWSIFLLLIPMTLHAETKYVSENLEITLRRGPGTEYKITHMIKAGTPMNILEETGEWSRIQMEDDREGWVLTRFLQSKVPDSAALKRLQTAYSALKDEADALKDENRTLVERSGGLAEELARHQNELGTLNTDYETLKNESSDFLKLQANHKKVVAELSEAKKKIGQLESELSSVYNDKRMNWVMVGAGVLLIGIIIGFITKPQRRRSLLR